ncbi:MAG: FAD-binding protein, partial [Verrucomicrobia bacterium]|nr:FAD-binding protein [Verrucomicrobiota bacterium]
MNEEKLTALSQTIKGTVITAGSPDYDSARKVYNGMIDRHPSAIVRCANVTDVQNAVRFAREADISVAIRGGGHNG